MKEIRGSSSSDFRSLLQRKLLERCEKNPAYSLRAYARSLNVAPSALSEMLKGRRPITPIMKRRLGLALGLSLDEIGGFRNHPPKDMAKFHEITLDSFALISDWYHYAILELIKVKDFVPDNGWIAGHLGITRSEVNIAIERLQRLGLIRIEGKKWIDRSKGHSTNIDGALTSAAAKKLQKQILEQSIRALEELPIQIRNHTSMTMAIDPKNLPAAMEIIKNFRRKLSHLLEKSGTVKEVYQLSVSLFPVTHIEDQRQSGERRFW